MELTDLGFDAWFEKERSRLARPDCSVARITRVDRDRFLVRNESGEVQTEPTGKLLFSADSSQELPCVGAGTRRITLKKFGPCPFFAISDND